MSSLFSSFEFPSKRVLVSTAASMAATAMLVRSIATDFIPYELRHYAAIKLHHFLATLSSEATLVIDEYDGLNKNRLYYAAELYIGTIVGPASKTYRASLAENEKKIHVTLGGHEEIADKFCGIQVKWVLITTQTQPRHVSSPDEFHYRNSTTITENRYLKLTFHKKHYNKVVNEYLPYVLERSEAAKEKGKTLKLFTLKTDRLLGPMSNPWQSANLDHPATFETLAMDDDVKNMIVGDLDKFLKRKEFYRKVGKAWKRGYLLFGPPGTGKSSLIAAMANYLNFDVYDVELADIRSNSELKKLLISTKNRSILVVEDIDASINLSERNNAAAAPQNFPFQQGPKMTLSGLLNIIDGLWSCIGDQRIIIFTTNHKDRLDPALLRPGRMDVHIHMSYCTPCGFRLLARNYLGLTAAENPLVSKAEELIGLIKVTPAEVGEQLLKSEDPELSLRGFIEFLEWKKGEYVRYGEEYFEEIAENGTDQLLKMSEGCDGLRELVTTAKPEMNGVIITKNEAANALKLLIGYLQQEMGNDSGTHFGHPTEALYGSVIPNGFSSG